MDKSLEKAAADGKILPKGLTAADSAEYIGLLAIYRLFRAGLMDKETAKRQKEALRYNCTKLRSEAEFLSREALALEERITAATEAYTDDKNLDTAEELYRAFYHLPPKR